MKKYYFSPILFLLVLSCTSNPEGAKNPNDASSADKAKVDSLAPPPQQPVSYFCTLKLTKENFDTLCGYPGKLLVFQFRYVASADSVSPRLVAYAMKLKHGSINDTDASRDLFKKYLDSLGTTTVAISGERILGDLQITIDKLKALRNTYTTRPKHENYKWFIFTPFYDDYMHLRYSVTVETNPAKQLTAHEVLNPSPPYSAQ